MNDQRALVVRGRLEVIEVVGCGVKIQDEVVPMIMRSAS